MSPGAGTLEAPATKSLEAILRDDHDRLDSLWGGAESLRVQDPAKAARLLGEFVSGLEEHIGIEEDFLFPCALDTRGGGYARLVEVMKEEHRQILALVSLIKEALNSDGMPSEEVRTELASILGDHNAREEGMFYPIFDSAFSDGEGRELRKKVLGRCSCPDH